MGWGSPMRSSDRTRRPAIVAAGLAALTVGAALVLGGSVAPVWAQPTTHHSVKVARDFRTSFDLRRDDAYLRGVGLRS